MPNKLETCFMNNLGPSLRKAAGELYVTENIESLVEFRLKNVPEYYQQRFSLSEHHWQRVLNSLILTKFSQLHVGNHLSVEYMMQLNYMVKIALDMEAETSDEIQSFLDENSKIFSQWYKKLIRLIKLQK